MGRAVPSLQRYELGSWSQKNKGESEGKGPVGYEGSQRQVEFFDSARKENILGRKPDKTGVVGRTSERPNHSVGHRFEVRGES